MKNWKETRCRLYVSKDAGEGGKSILKGKMSRSFALCWRRLWYYLWRFHWLMKCVPLHDSSLEATEVWAEKTRCKKPLKYWVIFNDLIHIIGASRSISSIRLWLWLQIKCENAHVQSFKLTFWRLNDLLLLYLNFFFFTGLKNVYANIVSNLPFLSFFDKWP